MKKHTFFLTFLLISFLHLSLYSQKTKTIKANFDKTKITKLDSYKVPKDQGILMEVNGINTSLHKVVVKFEDFYWYSEKAEALKSVFPGAVSTVLESKTVSEKEITDTIQIICKRIDLFTDSINGFKEILFSLYKTSTLDNNKIHSYADSVVKALQKDSIIIGHPLLTNGKLGPENLIIILENDILFLIGYYEALLAMSQSTSEYNDFVAKRIGEYKPVYENLKKNQSLYIAGIKNIVGLSKKAPEDKDFSKIYTPSKEVTTVKIYLLNKFDFSDTIAKYEGDIYRIGQLKLDFSSGIGVNTLVKPQYFIGTKDGTPFIGTEKARSIDYSVIALLHANWRLCPSISMGVASGVSVSAYDANTGYVLGFNTSFGKRNSGSLTAGAIIGKSIGLSKKVSTDGKSADLPLASDISTVPTYDKLGVGMFLSFTYNLARTKKMD